MKKIVLFYIETSPESDTGPWTWWERGLHFGSADSVEMFSSIPEGRTVLPRLT
jgi:hypothetical protein